MAETVAGDEEEIQNYSDDEDQLLNHDTITASPGCPASPLLASLNEDRENSRVPERLSILSSKAVAKVEALTGIGMVSGGQTQRMASGLVEHHLTAADASLGGSSYLIPTGNLQPVDIASLCSRSPCCNGELSLDMLHVPEVLGKTSEPPQAGTDRGGCHTEPAGSSIEGDMASCGLGRVTCRKTTKAMEALENKKQEEKEKYRLQLAMHRRLLLLRSIRSLHRQLEQQQARLQECYGTVINTKKEVLKHICSTSPSPSP